MTVALTQISTLPRDFADLRDEAEREDFHFVARLGDRWDGSAYDGDQLATVWGAFSGSALVAIGAQTHDEYDPSPLHRRIRHFYVRPEMRRTGVGRALALKLIADAHALAPRLHLRATRTHSAAFWDAVGFARVSTGENHTHVLVRA